MNIRKSATSFNCLQGIIISQFEQYDFNKCPLIMKKKLFS